MLIYQILHIESGKKYIGQTTRPAIERWREHLYPLRKGKHHNRFLQAAWNKYGEQAFKFEILKEVNTLEELNASEIELIQNGSDLFNLADGGNAFEHDIKAKKAIGKSNQIPIVGMNIKTGEIKHYDSAADAAIDGFNPACVRKCVLGYVSKRKDGTTFESISHKGWVWISKADFSIEILQIKKERAKIAKIRLERAVIGMHILTKKIIHFKSSSEAGRNGFTTNGVNRSCRTFNAQHRGFVWTYADSSNPQSLLYDKATYAISSVKRGPKSWLSSVE